MCPRQSSGKRRHGLAGGAVARIPGNLEVTAGNEIARYSRHVFFEHGYSRGRPLALGKRAGRSNAPQPGNVIAVERPLAEHEFEAILIRRVVRPGNHYAAVGVLVIDRIIQHGSRAETDPRNIDPTRGQAINQRRLEVRRRQPPVVADTNPAAALASDAGGEGAADHAGVGGCQAGPDDTANVVFA